MKKNMNKQQRLETVYLFNNEAQLTIVHIPITEYYIVGKRMRQLYKSSQSQLVKIPKLRKNKHIY